MLNGIGGTSIAAAKEALSCEELDLWRQYRERHGTLNLGLRIEQGAALAAFCANGCRGDFSDYLPPRDSAAGADAAALARAMKEWA
ncbi:hypothetical protein [Pantoea sp. 18069]|uniref:hypothetical protein n=1 Tax=Pantoea sp. 18069 TaxID=2681415 RepID=UPI0013596AEF|nr:hypothetical protein [Pantoea sp. 18069]